MNKERFRFYIKVRTALHIQPIVIHNELYSVFGDGALLSELFKDGQNGFVKVEKKLKMKKDLADL